MSLLSTFSILFETDARNATRETEELSGALDDVSDSASDATQDMDDTTEVYEDNAISVGVLTKAMAGMISAFVTFDAIQSKVFSTAEGIDVIGKLSQTIGVNIAELDAWGIAAERNGGSAEALRGTVTALQGSLQDIAINGGGRNNKHPSHDRDSGNQG